MVTSGLVMYTYWLYGLVMLALLWAVNDEIFTSESIGIFGKIGLSLLLGGAILLSIVGVGELLVGVDR